MVTLFAIKMGYIDYIDSEMDFDKVYFFLAFLLLTFVWIVIVCLAMHGTRKNMKRPISAYIIFSMVWLLLQAYNDKPDSLALLDVTSSSLKIIVTFLYNIGYFVVLYNIMNVSPDNCQEMNHMCGCVCICNDQD